MRRVQGEQSNSSMIYGSRLILKFVRRVEAGVHPELDISRYLTEKSPLPFVPPLAGGLTYRRPGIPPMTVALLHGYIRSAGNGWDYTIDLLGRYYEQVLGNTQGSLALDMTIQRLLALTDADLPEEVRTAVTTYLVPAENLGQRTAALHLALAEDRSDAAFAPEPMTAADLTALAADLCRPCRGGPGSPHVAGRHAARTVRCPGAPAPSPACDHYGASASGGDAYPRDDAHPVSR